MEKECGEWVENKEGEPIMMDNHVWREIEKNERIQVLRCDKCKKISTGKIVN